MLKQFIAIIGLSTAVIAALAASGCAKQEFRKETFQASAGAVGFRYLAPKVDILLVPDNTPSVNAVFSTLQGQLKGFVQNLQGQYWDYHVGNSPVFYPSAPNGEDNGSQNVGSRILVNSQFNTDLLSDGTDTNAAGIVPAQYALTDPSAFSILDTTYTTGSGDYTYRNTIHALNNSLNGQTNFLRPDALLAVVIITNGFDRTVTDQNASYIAGGDSALQGYANQLIGLKGSSTYLRVYPVAASSYNTTPGGNCYSAGGTSFNGLSFTDILKKGVQGMSADFCNPNALNSVMGNIASNLSAIRQSYIYSNIVLADEPIPSSIDIAKQVGGDPARSVHLAEDSINGWKYKGYETVYTVTGICDQSNKTNVDPTGACPGGTITPVSLSSRTGYVIQLNGGARMMGKDNPVLTYQKR